jgi:uncharacterized RDD family membrane protein YckC
MTTDSSSGQLDFSHWLIRLIAFVIDSIIIAIPTAIIWVIIGIAIVFSPASFLAVYGISLLFPFIFGIIEVLYFAFLDSYWGATIGKRVLGLQVQTVSGGKVPFDKAFIRNISKIYWLFLLIDWIIGVATAGPDRRQKWTDRIAGTTVVQVGRAPFGTTAPPPPPPPPPAPS